MMRYYIPAGHILPGDFREITREEMEELVGAEDLECMEQFAIDNGICEEWEHDNAVVTYTDDEEEDAAIKQAESRWVDRMSMKDIDEHEAMVGPQ